MKSNAESEIPIIFINSLTIRKLANSSAKPWNFSNIGNAN